MPRIYKPEFPCHKIQYPFKGGNEHSLTVGFTQKIIYLCKHFPQIPARLGMILDQCLSDNHEQRCRNTFAGYICCHNSQVTFIYHKKVIKVAAYFPCRLHKCKHVKFFSFRESRKNAGKHRLLDIGGHVQFRCCFYGLCALVDGIKDHPEFNHKNQTHCNIQQKEPRVIGINPHAV